MTDPACPAEFVRFAQSLAELSGPIVRRLFRTGLAVEDKADSSPVTVADREVERAVRGRIEAVYPDHGIVGEELGTLRPGASHLWVIDPIDGTKAFMSGKPMFGTLIALLRDGKPILGIVDQPVLSERWVGAVGRATTFCGEPARTRPCQDIAMATMNSTHPDMFKAPEHQARYRRLAERVKLTMFGGDCYAYGLCASGHIDIVIERGLKLYDVAALVPVIVGAGGRMTDWQGRDIAADADGTALAAGDAGIHEAALRLLRG
jgi:histidinol phosphatase-like enzyme (inositol monophosphatase family)